MDPHERAAERACTKCGETKPHKRFSGKASWCKDCINEYSKQHYQRNKKKVLKQKRVYRKENKEKVARAQRKYRESNSEKLRAYLKEYREAHKEELAAKKREYYLANKDEINARRGPRKEYNKKLIAKRRKQRQSDPAEMAKHNYSRALRRKAEKQATPEWCDLEKVKAVYEEAQRLTAETGIKHSVDHIYPLQGENVCGLHVPENLQVMPLAENCSKQNKFPSDDIA